MEHQITVCTSCRQKGSEQRPGFEVIDRLRRALQAVGTRMPARFDVSGVACMAGCDHPCTVAFHGAHKATYLFGDIDPAQDVDDLVKFARLYAYLHDGWCSSVDRPGKLRTSTLARVPAALVPRVDNQDDAS